MTWTRLDDRWTDGPGFERLDYATRWHYLAMIQFCSRTERYDGVLRRSDARRCSDVDDPDAALLALAGAELIRLDEELVRLLHIADHIPPPSIRNAAAATKVRMQRLRKHRNGDHRECLPEHCPAASGDASRDAERDSSPQPGDGCGDASHQDGTGQARTTAAVTSNVRALESEDDPPEDIDPWPDDGEPVPSYWPRLARGYDH